VDELNRVVLGPLIARGRTAEVYAWGEDRVAKLFYDWCPSDWARHEADVARIVSGKGLPAPKLVDVTEINGRSALIYERVHGPSMLELFMSRLWLLGRCARQMAELHAALHRQSGAGLGSLREYLVREIGDAKDVPPDLRQEGLRSLEQLPDSSALCHGDFHPQQVLITAHGPVIIDWMTALQGHPAADVARTTILLTIGQVPGANLATRMLTSAFSGYFCRTYTQRYLRLNPDVTREQVRAWLFPVAIARLREGIAGEREPLLKLIESSRPSAPVAPVVRR
jgi:hypothetical protein